MLQRLIALLLVAAMAGMTVGCGRAAGDAATAQTGSGGAPAAQAKAGEAEEKNSEITAADVDKKVDTLRTDLGNVSTRVDAFDEKVTDIREQSANSWLLPVAASVLTLLLAIGAALWAIGGVKRSLQQDFSDKLRNAEAEQERQMALLATRIEQIGASVATRSAHRDVGDAGPASGARAPSVPEPPARAEPSPRPAVADRSAAAEAALLRGLAEAGQGYDAYVDMLRRHGALHHIRSFDGPSVTLIVGGSASAGLDAVVLDDGLTALVYPSFDFISAFGTKFRELMAAGAIVNKAFDTEIDGSGQLKLDSLPVLMHGPEGWALKSKGKMTGFSSH